MKGLRGRETVGSTESESKRKKEGEGKALTSCGNTHFSHELIQAKKVTYSIPNTYGKKARAQCVRRLDGPPGSI